MVEVTFNLKTVDLPYSLRLYGVTEEMFDELVDEDMKAELIDGVMIVHSPATMEHADLGEFVRMLMRLYATEKKAAKVLGPDTSVHLAPGRKFAPDILLIAQHRVPTPLPREWEGSPDLVAEILSPSNRKDDLQIKRPAYRQAGVKEIWFVDPQNQEVIVDRKKGRNYRETVATEGRVSSQVLKGFWLETSWLWAEPLPGELACLREILGGG